MSSTGLAIDSQGTGPDIVCLHGWGMNAAVWSEVVEVLSKNHRVHCVDLPGHGASPWLAQTAYKDWLQQLHDAITRLTDQPFILLGWSLGGLLAMGYAERYPEQVKKMILVAATPCYVQTAGWSSAMQAGVLKQFSAALLKDFETTLMRFLSLQIRGAEHSAETLRELRKRVFARGKPHPEALVSGLAHLAEQDRRASIEHLACPVQLIGGERDTLVPPAAILWQAGVIPDAQAHIVEGAGHAPFLSHTSEFIQCVSEFIHAG